MRRLPAALVAALVLTGCAQQPRGPAATPAQPIASPWDSQGIPPDSDADDGTDPAPDPIPADVKPLTKTIRTAIENGKWGAADAAVEVKASGMAYLGTHAGIKRWVVVQAGTDINGDPASLRLAVFDDGTGGALDQATEQSYIGWGMYEANDVDRAAGIAEYIASTL